MAVDQAWQQRLALGVDHFGILRNRHVAALADRGKLAIADHNHRIGNRRAARAIDQRAALDDDRPARADHGTGRE